MNQSKAGARELDVLGALRAATASRHERLDSSLPLSREHAGLEEVAAHLSLLRNWLGPLQAWLDAYEDGPQQALPAVERLGLIALDLAEPGMPAPEAPAAVHAWPEAASAAYRWGVCYVIEGSQLGGTVLYNRLSARLAPHPLRYLRGEEGGPGPRWRAFMLALRDGVRTPEELAEACSGACAAFDSIIALGLDD